MSHLTLADMLTQHAHLTATARAKYTSRVDQLEAVHYVDWFILGHLAHQLSSTEDGRKAWQDAMRAAEEQLNNLTEEGDR